MLIVSLFPFEIVSYLVFSIAAEIGFVDVAQFGTQASSTGQDGNLRFSQPEPGLLKSQTQLEFISNKEVPPMGGFSPFKTMNYGEDDVQSLQFEPGSPMLYSNDREVKSKENYFYPQHLSLEQNNFADFQDNQNYFEDCEDEPLGLILGESPSQKKTQTTMARNLKLNFDDSDSENEDTNHLRDYEPFSKMEEDLGKIFTKRKLSGESNASDMLIGHYESTLDTNPMVSQGVDIFTSGLMQGIFLNYIQLYHCL